MESVAIIGAGISGLAVAHLLKQKYKVVLFEKETVAGGLIRCIRVNGSLYHICGGHVFNSKKQNVLDWFWNRFDKDCEFSKAIRNSVVFMTESKHVPYPIENYVYLFEPEIQKSIIHDLLALYKCNGRQSENFEEFLKIILELLYTSCISNHIMRKYGDGILIMSLCHGLRENSQCPI